MIVKIREMDKRRKTPKLEEMESHELKFAMKALKDLMKDTVFVKQRKTFEDVQKAIEKAIEKERRMHTRCLKLQSEIEANTSKIKAAIQLSDEDKNTIDTLKEELEKAWNVADELRMKRSESLDVDRFSEGDKRSMCSSTLSFQRKNQDFEEFEKISTSEKKSLRNEVEFQRKTSETLNAEIKQLKQQVKNMSSILSKKNEEIKKMETNFKVLEEMKMQKEQGKGDQAAIIDEIEKSRLQIFELEEELTNKEKVVEELRQENKLSKLELEQLKKEILTQKDSFLSEKINDKKIDLLTKEIEQKTLELEQLKKEILTKDIFHAKRIEGEKYILEVKRDKEKGEGKNYKNIKKQRDELLNREKEMALKLKLLEFALSEKINLISRTQNDNDLLSASLHKEKEWSEAFLKKYNKLERETIKCIKTLKELENSRNKYVSIIGKLETKNYKLEKELVALENCKYPEKIKNMEHNLKNIRRGLEEKVNYIRETDVEISKIKSGTEEFSKHVIDSLKIIELIHTTRDTLVEAKSKFCNGKLSIEMENINLSILLLKDRIKDLVERYKEITMEKYKLYDEIEFLKCQKHSVKENEFKWTKTEHNYFDEHNSNQRTETDSSEHISNLDVKVLESNRELEETDEEIKTINEETTLKEYETYLTFIKPEILPSGLEIHHLNSASDNKSEKADLIRSSVIPVAEKNPSFINVSANRSSEASLEKKFRTQEAQNMSSLQKTIKKATSIPDVITSKDLVKYRHQLRLKQKRLDTMKKELESSSSSFSVNSGIYPNGKGKINNVEAVKKILSGQDRRK